MTPFRLLSTSLTVVLLLANAARAATPDKYLLDDSDGLIVLNVRSLVASPLFKQHYLDLVQKTIQGSEIAQREFKEIGLDPLKDIQRFLIVHAEGSHRLGAKPGDKGETGLYFILHGKFDAAKLQTRAAQIAKDSPKLLKVHKAGAGTLYEFALAQPVYVAMPDKTTLVVSPFREQVVEALEKGAGKRKLQLKSKEMQTLIGRAEAKQSLWLAAVGTMVYDFNTIVTVVKGKKVEKTTKETLVSAGVTSISGGVTVGDGIKTEILITCPNEKTAKQTAQYIQQDVNEMVQRAFQASLKQKQFDPLREYLRQLEAIAKGKEVTVRGEITAKDFENALK